ncbi:hypothetical protein WJX79_004419 [Trebouxia sp. C0005]
MAQILTMIHMYPRPVSLMPVSPWPIKRCFRRQSLVKCLVSMVWHGRPLAVFWCAEALYHRSHMLLGVTILDHECEASKTGYPADDETCCCNPSCNQPMFLNGKARKTFRTLSVQSVVKAAFASKDLAAELKKDPPVSSHASILRGWADERQG